MPFLIFSALGKVLMQPLTAWHSPHRAAIIPRAEETRFSTLLWKETVNLGFSSEFSTELVVSHWEKPRAALILALIYVCQSKGSDGAEDSSTGGVISLAFTAMLLLRRGRYWAEVSVSTCSRSTTNELLKDWLLPAPFSHCCCCGQTLVQLCLFHAKMKPSPRGGLYFHSTLPGVPS